MPYIEGETLGERIDRERRLPVDEALRIATAVANALHTAHEQGVIHHDIKPGNILLSRGEPLVADFGIALAVSAGGSGRLTETGLSLGPPYYMSPEQATGDQAVGPASDTFALACVLYEMLAGKPPFSASTAQAVLVKILTSDAASITSVRGTVPAHVDGALARALEKLPADRFGSAAGFAAALADESFRYQAQASTPMASTPEPAAAPTTVVPARPWHRDARSAVVLMVALTTSALAAWGWLRPGPDPGVVTRSSVAGIDNIAPVGGRRLAISPDGQSVAFNVNGGISKVSINSGPALPVAASGSDPHWGFGETIVYNDGNGALYRVSSSGGDPQVPLDSDSVEVGNEPRYVPTGRLIYGHADGALMGVPFDVESLEVTGQPVTLLPSLAVFGTGASQFDVSDNGTLIYATAAGELSEPR